MYLQKTYTPFCNIDIESSLAVGKEKRIYHVQKTEIQQPEISSFRSKKTVTNYWELRVSNVEFSKKRQNSVK